MILTNLGLCCKWWSNHLQRKEMTTTESRRLESLIEKVFRLNEEVNQKRQQEQPYQRLRELEKLLGKREVEVV